MSVRLCRSDDRDDPQRRRVLQGLLGGAAAGLWNVWPGRLGGGAVARAASKPLTATPLRNGLVGLSGGVGGNIVLAADSGGIVMVDSGAADDAASVLSLVTERYGGTPIQFLFNTHWHLAHTGGNEALARAGALTIAHENTRLWMSTRFYVDWHDRTYSPRPSIARPAMTFYSSDPQPIELAAAGRRIEYGHLPGAHTDGDIYVRFPDDNVIAAGGAVTVGRYPVVDYITGGSLDGLIDATNKLLELGDGDTQYVPAVGPAQSARHLEAQRDMLSAVREDMVSMANEGRSATEMLAAGITEAFDAYWGSNAERFLLNAYLGRWGIGL